MKLIIIAFLIGCIALCCSVGHGVEILQDETMYQHCTIYKCSKHGELKDAIWIYNYGPYCPICIEEKLDKFLGCKVKEVKDEKVISYRNSGVPSLNK